MSSTKVFVFGEQERIKSVQLGDYATKHLIDQSRGIEAKVAPELTADQTATPMNANSSPVTRQTTDLHECHVPMPPTVAGDSASPSDTSATPTQQRCHGPEQAFSPFTLNLPPRLRKARPGRRERALRRLQRQADLLQETVTQQQNQTIVRMPSHGIVEAQMRATNVMLPLPGFKGTDKVFPHTPGDLSLRQKAKPGRRERALRRLQRQAGLLQEPSTLHHVEALGRHPSPDLTPSPTPTTRVDMSSPGVEGDIVGIDGAQSLHDRQLAGLGSNLAQGQADDVQKAAASQHDHPSISLPPYDPIALGLEAARFILQQHRSSQCLTEATAHDQPRYAATAQERQLVDWAIRWQQVSGLPGDGASTATETLPQIYREQAESGTPRRTANVESLPLHDWQPKPFTPSSPLIALNQGKVVPMRNLKKDEYEAPYAFHSEWPLRIAHQAPEVQAWAPYEAPPTGTALPQAGALLPQRTEAPYAQELVQSPAALEPSGLPPSPAIYPFVDCPGPCPADCPRRLGLARAYPRNRQGRLLSRLPCRIRFDPFSEDLDREWVEPQYYPAANAGEPNSPTSPASSTTATPTSAPTRAAGFNAPVSPCSSCERLARTGEEILYTTCCGYKSATVPAETDGVTTAIPVRRERRRVGLVGPTPWWDIDQRKAHRYLVLLQYLEYRAVLRAKTKEANPEESDRPPLMPLWIHFPELLPPVFEVPPENMLQLQLSGN